MIRNTLKHCATMLCVLLVSLCCILQVGAVTLSNNITITTDAAFNYGINASISGDTYSVWSLTKYVATSQSIYINNSASTEQLVTINCDISVGSSGCYVTINGTNYNANAAGKEISFAIAANSSSTITLYAAKGKYTTAITFNSITSVSNVTSTVTFEPATGGNYTVSGSAITASTPTTCTANGLAVVATPSSGYEFVAWVTVNSDGTYGEIAGLAASGTLRVGSDCTVKPLFAATATAMYWVNGCIYDSWTGAFSAAGTNHPVLLYKSGTLTAGTYTIESGQKLLIPYSVTHYSDTDLRTAAFGAPLDSTTAGTLAAYRTLTLASGATISCSGQISVDAWQYSSSVNNTGRVAGPYGQIKLEEGSAINLNETAVLYCYGYITGKGTVTANSGSAVHELFQMMDWRGGNVAYNTYEDMKGESFLVSQFYVQNIESNLIVNYNANVISYVTVAAALVGDKKPYASSMALIGNEGLFVLESGASVSRKYDTTDGRIKYEVTGNAKIDSITLSITAATIVGNQTVTMYSSDYILNIPSSMSITIKSGATVEMPNRIKLLPDTVLTIEEGATLNLTSGTDSDGNTVNAELILYDYDDWTGGPDEYSWGCDFKAVNHSPSGKKMTGLSGGSARLIVNGNLNIADGAAVYSTNDIEPTKGNSCLSGTGTITWGTAPSSSRESVLELVSDTNGLLEVTLEDGTTTSYPPVAVTLLQAPLAGISSSVTDYTRSMSHAASSTSPLTYHSKDGEYWYNYTISVDQGVSGLVPDPAYFGSESYNAADPIVAYICSGETFTFTADGYDVYRDSVADENKLSGSLTGISADTTLVLVHTHSYESVVTPPNCTTGGYTTHTCTVCGDSYVADEVAALGHSYSGVHTAPADGAVGYTTYTCSSCGDSYVEYAVFYGTNVRAGDTLDIYFYVYKAGFDESQISNNGYYAEVSRSKVNDSGDAETITKQIPSGSWESYGNDYLRFSYDGIAAKEMTDIVSVTIYDASGKQFSTTIDESIETYALRAWSHYSADTYKELRTTLVDMLNYGAAAQTKFGYRTDDLASAELTENHTGSGEVEPGSDTQWTTGEGTYKFSATVTARSELYFTFYFTKITKDMTAEVTYEDHYGNAKTVEVAGSEFVAEGNYLGVKVTGLSIADGRQVMTCKVYDGEEVVIEVQSSVQSYIYKVLNDGTSGSNLKNLCTALMKFIDSAYNYFH